MGGYEGEDASARLGFVGLKACIRYVDVGL